MIVQTVGDGGVGELPIAGDPLPWVYDNDKENTTGRPQNLSFPLDSD